MRVRKYFSNEREYSYSMPRTLQKVGSGRGGFLIRASYDVIIIITTGAAANYFTLSQL